MAYHKGYHGPDKIDNIRIGFSELMKMLAEMCQSVVIMESMGRSDELAEGLWIVMVSETFPGLDKSCSG